MACHTCAECDWLTRTSPEQVFLKCAFWSARPLPVPYAPDTLASRDDVVIYCHRQPSAPACAFFKAVAA